MGKTAVALLVAAEHLATLKEKACLFLAPTRPLTHQHHRYLTDHLNLNAEDVVTITGEDPLKQREEEWRRRIICATPQVTVNDVKRGIVRLEDFSLVVFDEAHRAVGNYAYSLLGTLLSKTNSSCRIVGLTASLPAEQEKVKEILLKLGLRRVEVRDESSEDVKPYVQRTIVEWVRLTLPPVLLEIRDKLNKALNSRVNLLQEAKLLPKRQRVNGMKTLLDLRRDRRLSSVKGLKSALFSSIRLVHAIGILETQSVSSFVHFMDRLARRRMGVGTRSLIDDSYIKETYEAARGALILGIEHPKLERLSTILEGLKNGEKAIVFASYRSSVEAIRSRLSSSGFKAKVLIGKSGESGLSQKEQVKVLDELRQGVINVLVATQVGEEGLDVSECNLVVFYDNVPSAVRFIQRKGRTGRRSPGRVVILMTEGTRDEAYYWLSRRRLIEAKEVHTRLRTDRKGPMDSFMEESYSDTPQWNSKD